MSFTWGFGTLWGKIQTCAIYLRFYLANYDRYAEESIMFKTDSLILELHKMDICIYPKPKQ